jgi:hypothetical protein
LTQVWTQSCPCVGNFKRTVGSFALLEPIFTQRGTGPAGDWGVVPAGPHHIQRLLRGNQRGNQMSAILCAVLGFVLVTGSMLTVDWCKGRLPALFS